jgi:uncharacterized protein YacL
MTALLLQSIKILFPQPEALAFPFIPSIPIAFFITLFLLIKEPVQKTVRHLFPWLEEETTHSENQRMLIPDLACLEDGRICDLVRTGLLDHQLILPHFLIEKVRNMMDEEDEFVKERAKQTFESIRRLEAFGIICKKNPEVKTLSERSFQDKLFDYAKEHKASILSNDSALQNTVKPEHYDVPIVFLEAVASALKTTIPKGQQLSIKIQRPGKEPKQGIGYLDDRTMVVVNGGGDFIGQLVKIQILSQKFSASGKIIFCNLLETPNAELNRSYATIASNNDFQE